MNIESQLEQLRKEYVKSPHLREIIKRRARALEIAKELKLRKQK